MIKIYLDTCSLNRPFDDQDFTKVRLETEAIHLIKSGIYGGRYSLSWSFMPDYEINESPFDKRLDSIIEWKGLSLDFCKPFEAVLSRGREIERLGIKRKDSLHIASAIEMKCGYFITTDRRIFNKTIPDIETMNPREFVSKMEVRQ